MAYELHIERNPELSMAEWRAAVEADPRLRYGPVDTSATNPRTGEVIVVRGAEGDAAIELDGQWINVFRWSKGRISFTARTIGDPVHPVTKVAFALAHALAAEVRGQEGEIYRPST